MITQVATRRTVCKGKDRSREMGREANCNNLNREMMLALTRAAAAEVLENLRLF